MEYFLFWNFSVLYKVKSNRAYIIDPANPTNNLYDAVDCWDEVQKVAEETMRTPLLRDVLVTAKWKWRTTSSEKDVYDIWTKSDISFENWGDSI